MYTALPHDNTSSTLKASGPCGTTPALKGMAWESVSSHHSSPLSLYALQTRPVHGVATQESVPAFSLSCCRESTHKGNALPDMLLVRLCARDKGWDVTVFDSKSWAEGKAPPSISTMEDTLAFFLFLLFFTLSRAFPTFLLNVPYVISPCCTKVKSVVARATSLAYPENAALAFRVVVCETSKVRALGKKSP